MSGDIIWTPGIPLEELEKQAILKAFKHHRGNKTVTAQSLGISIRTLDTKLASYLDQEKKFEEQKLEIEHKRIHDLERARGGVSTNVFTGYPNTQGEIKRAVWHSPGEPVKPVVVTHTESPSLDKSDKPHKRKMG